MHWGLLIVLQINRHRRPIPRLTRPPAFNIPQTAVRKPISWRSCFNGNTDCYVDVNATEISAAATTVSSCLWYSAYPGRPTFGMAALFFFNSSRMTFVLPPSNILQFPADQASSLRFQKRIVMRERFSIFRFQRAFKRHAILHSPIHWN